MQPKVTIARKSSGVNPLGNLLKTLGSHAAYVGIPASSARDRAATLTSMAGKITSTSKKGKAKKARIQRAATEDVSNAELLFIHTKGSAARNIPPRPVLEPAIEADGNRQAIAAELAAASRAGLTGDQSGVMIGLKRAAIAGQNASRKWFTDGRNNWAPNAPSTVKAKRSDKPLIDTGALRHAIVGIVE